MGAVYQIKIQLKNAKPTIWRRVKLNSTTSLNDLHKIIQSTMGWENAHLHQFVVGDKYYMSAEEVKENLEFDDYNRNVDYTDIIIADVLKKEKDKIEYEYDFGDGWEHIVTLEKIFENEIILYPKCIKGKAACPPENCGGVWGYMNIIKTMKNPKHPEYEDIKNWLGGGLDIDDFDIDMVNEQLMEEDYGIIDLSDFFN